MPRSLNLSLTDELRAFLDRNSGDGTLYATPSEFVRSLIREEKERQDAGARAEAQGSRHGEGSSRSRRAEVLARGPSRFPPNSRRIRTLRGKVVVEP